MFFIFHWLELLRCSADLGRCGLSKNTVTAPNSAPSRAGNALDCEELGRIGRAQMREIMPNGLSEEVHSVFNPRDRHASSILSTASAARRSGRIFTSSGSARCVRVCLGPMVMRPFSASRIFHSK